MIMDDPEALIRKMNEVAPIGPQAPTGGEKVETAYRVTFTLVLDRPEAAGKGGDS